MPTTNSLDQLTLQSLQRCLTRVSGISSGTWRAACAAPYPGGPADALKQYEAAATAVYLRLEGLPLFALMLINPDELECVSLAFTGHSFPRGQGVNSADQVMLSELGNILLNAMLNPLINAVKKSAMPSLPRFFEGPAAELAAELAALPGPGVPLRVVPAGIALECRGAFASVRLFAFLPEDYALQIERA
jgi:hypothetical protein